MAAELQVMRFFSPLVPTIFGESAVSHLLIYYAGTVLFIILLSVLNRKPDRQCSAAASSSAQAGSVQIE
jgi:hypothetical protein